MFALAVSYTRKHKKFYPDDPTNYPWTGLQYYFSAETAGKPVFCVLDDMKPDLLGWRV